VRFGGALNSGPNQWQATGQYLLFNQEGDAPGDPKPTNDRRMGGVGLDWRHALDTKRQLGLSVQVNAVRFPRNEIEDFDQVFVAASWLKSFERPGVPLLYLTAFGSHDRAVNKFADGVTTKSKDLAGLRSYFPVLAGSESPAFQRLGGDPPARHGTPSRARRRWRTAATRTARPRSASVEFSREMRAAVAVRFLGEPLQHRHLRFDRHEVSSDDPLRPAMTGRRHELHCHL
jgi:hypothetical protein